jgi:acetyl esterase/lipase
MSQDGQGFRGFAEYIAKNKYAAALISYRGRPTHQYQTTILDVKSAVSYIKNNSAKYAIDPAKIGAMGRSAGATLAALLAVAGDSAQVQAAVAYSGVFDFVARFTDSSQTAHQPKLATTLQTNSEWIGAPFSTEDPNWKQASASNHLDKNDSPILFMHCKDDKVVSWIQSQKMYEKMKDSGINSEIIYFEKGGHGFGSVEKELFLKPMISFFKKQFE